MYIDLTPTYYVNEIEGIRYQGYRGHLKNYERGSIVNERTMLNSRTPRGFPNEGFELEFITETNENVYQVRVVRHRSFLEIMALILGLVAGKSLPPLILYRTCIHFKITEILPWRSGVL